jgi:hypothetical protein
MFSRCFFISLQAGVEFNLKISSGFGLGVFRFSAGAEQPADFRPKTDTRRPVRIFIDFPLQDG